MFDVKRFRERAADWLIDVGYSTLLRLGDAAEIVRGEPHEEEFQRDDEFRARATAAGTSPPAGQDPAPHPTGGGQPVDSAPRWGWWAMAPRRRALLTRWLGAHEPGLGLDLVEAADVRYDARAALRIGAGHWWEQPAGHRRAYIAWLEAQRPVVDGEELSHALVGSACDLLRGSTAGGDVPPGPGVGSDVKPPHNAAPGALGEAREVGICSRPRCPEGDTLRAMGRYCPCGAELRPVGVVTPPEAVGTLGGAALAADIEEQRISHGGCTRLPREMLAALGVKDGDLVWLLRSQPGGRWEAWTSDELNQEFGMGDAAEANAAVDRMPRHVASRLTAGEARRLEARGFVASVAWHDETSENMYGPWHERDADDLAHVRQKAADRATHPVASAAEMVPESPSGGAGAPWRGLEHEVQAHRSDLDTWVVEAVAHGSEGEIYAAHFSGQHAEARAREYAALMSVRAGTSDAGKDPEIVALRERGFTLSPDLEARAAHVLRGVGEAPAVHEERPVVDTRWGAALEREAKASESYRDPVARRDAAILRAAAKLVRTEEDARLILEALGWINPDAVERVLFGEDEDGEGDAEPALPKPDAVRVGQRWRSEAFASPVDVTDVYDGIANVNIGDRHDDTVPVSTILGNDAWSYLGMVKPERVEAGQRWRCVGVEGELVVRWLFGDGVSVRLGPAEDEADGKIVARTADMLGLREWSYVGGAR